MPSGREQELPGLVGHLEAAVGSAEEPEQAEEAGAESEEASDETHEAFVTALVLDVPDHEPVVRLVNCGYPPPLLLSRGRVVPLGADNAYPPLELSDVLSPEVTADSFAFETGDVLLLHTDGVLEARDRSRPFHPLTERLTAWAGAGPQALLDLLQDDLHAHAGDRLGDDAALVAVERLPPAG
ncbi:PP2C family protein-serine/threonine phosphatase [Streptomyces sp. NPDC007872]|uniref:PP2C family protein-serine/threonine phosphatase n=1 Tax=Streptomyces sp. NPDC007872 TaxID=3364782 RepID=UPI0036B5B8E9